GPGVHARDADCASWRSEVNGGCRNEPIGCRLSPKGTHNAFAIAEDAISLTQRDIVVLGASAGGIEAITPIFADPSVDLPAAVFIVVHVAPQSPGHLAGIFDRAGPLPVQNAHQGQTFSTGRVYVAPPDRHLLLGANGRILLSRGPRENLSRPAIDPLFRSAALAFGPRVIGAVLLGGLDDGCAGLRRIKMCGGTTIVQDPTDAVADSMPRNALRSTDVDYCQSARRLGQLIDKLVRAELQDVPVPLEGKRMRKRARARSGNLGGRGPGQRCPAR